jgi:hypothetical protein
MKRSRRIVAAKGSFLAVVAAVGVLAVATSFSAAAPQFSGWSEPVNLGPTINTSVTESGPALSKDGLSLYFYSVRAPGVSARTTSGSHSASRSTSRGERR